MDNINNTDTDDTNDVELYNYIHIDKYVNKQGEDKTEFKEHEGKLIIKQYSGIKTDNFIIKKFDSKKILFSFFKLNGIHYININGEHILDYRKFIHIQQILQINDSSIKIKNGFVGDFIINNCDTEIFHKALDVMNTYMKTHRSYMGDFLYYLFN